MTSGPPKVVAHRLLDAFLAEPGVAALDALLRWLLEASPQPQATEVPRTRRLALLAEVLHTHPRQTELLELLRGVWTHGSTVRLLAETGLPVHLTLVKESLERLVDGLVPRLEPDDDLYVLLSRLRLGEADATWVESLSTEVLAPWRALVALPDRVLLDAARLVAFRTSAVGLARELLELEPERPEALSPYFHLSGVVERLAADPHDHACWAEWSALHDECHRTLATARERLERRGVSTDLI